MPEDTKAKSTEKPTKPSEILKELMKMNHAMLSPYQKGVMEKLQEMGALHAEEAVNQRVPPEEVASKANLNSESLLSGLVSQANPQSSATAPQKDSMGSDRSLLNNLLISVGAGMATAGGHSDIATGLLDFVSKRDKMIMDSKSNLTVDPLLARSRDLNNQLMEAQIQALRGSGNDDAANNLEKIPEIEREDYVVKPVQQKIRGVLTTVPVVERKKTLPAAQLNELSGLEDSKRDMGSIVERLKKSGLQLGPGLSTRPGAIADMLGQIKGSEFASLKADIGRNFQKYRKWATGVAAGYPELQMLAVNYPKATDTNDVFIQKTIDSMKDIERQKQLLLDHYSKGGYAVSQLRGLTSKIEESTGSGLAPDKAKRLEELRRKKAEGTLGK